MTGKLPANKKKQPPIVNIPTKDLASEELVSDGYVWSTNDLIKAVKEQKCVPFAVPLASISTAVMPWELASLADFLFHYKATDSTDLKYPIIYSPNGVLVDGYHRVVKAVLKGKTEIMAVRLHTMSESHKQGKDE